MMKGIRDRMKGFNPFMCTGEDCAGGMVYLEARAGRFRGVRQGIWVLVPEDFEIPTCTVCRKEFELTSKAVMGMIEAEYAKHRDICEKRIQDYAANKAGDWN